MRSLAALGLVVGVTLQAAGVSLAAEPVYPVAKVSFDDFKGLVAAVESHRARRLISFDKFKAMSQQEGVVILDTRSADRFQRIHIKGARHLAFTDFTAENLRKVIPSLDTPILIYCNNNFRGNQIDFATKTVAPPKPSSTRTGASEFTDQATPTMMALNVHTYLNLYGYGYRNVYELHELVGVDDPRVTFEGTTVSSSSSRKTPAPPAYKQASQTKSPAGRGRLLP